MASRQQALELRPKQLLDGAVYTATQTSAALDTIGSESASIIIGIGAAAITGTFTPSLVECDTIAGTYTAVADPLNVDWYLDGVQIPNGPLIPGNPPTQASVAPVVSTGVLNSTTIMASYVGGTKRFIKAVMTGATTPSANFGIIGVCSRLREVGPKVYTNWPAFGQS